PSQTPPTQNDPHKLRRLRRSTGPRPQEKVRSASYASSLLHLQRFEEAKALLRIMLPVARRVLGENNEITLKTRAIYARSLYEDPAATLDDLRKAVTTLEEIERTARRVLGGAHPLTTYIERCLRCAQAALRARETPPSSPGA
ncbi:unnamed protein product, partial [Pelagomonas calceolata]